MAKRAFRAKSQPAEPAYPRRRQLLAIGAAVAIVSLGGCGLDEILGDETTGGVPLPPAMDASVDAGMEQDDGGLPDASFDAGEVVDGDPVMPDAGE